MSSFSLDNLCLNVRILHIRNIVLSSSSRFTRSEFDDLVIRHYPSSKFCFHSSFLEAVFNITNGHVGAIHNFINIIIADDVSLFVFTGMVA